MKICMNKNDQTSLLKTPINMIDDYEEKLTDVLVSVERTYDGLGKVFKVKVINSLS
ncbi:hypothetical protein ACW95P_01765 [Candidatus Mycoplasma pogonae]